MAKYQPAPDGYHWVCRPWIRLKNGRILYAAKHNKKAFCFLVSDE